MISITAHRIVSEQDGSEGGTVLAREVRLDNRGLDPPEPLMRTMEALNGLEGDDVLVIHNDRRPMFLYPKLAQRGFDCETQDQPDGSAIVRIWKG